MATRNNTLNIPDEFDSDDVADTPANNEPSGALSLSDLTNMSFNDERDEQELAKLNPPPGDWQKEDRWEGPSVDLKYKRVNTEDQQTGDIDPSGRTFLTFMGKPETRFANDMEYSPTLFLRISPDIRYKQDKPQEVDHAYKLFLKAKDLYLTLHDQKPTNLGQLIDMLEEDNYTIRTLNGDSGPFILDIKPKRQMR